MGLFSTTLNLCKKDQSGIVAGLKRLLAKGQLSTVTTKQPLRKFLKRKKPKTIDENKVIARQGGTIAGNTRKQIEAKTGKKVVSKLNARNIVEGKPKKKKLR